MRLDQAFSDSFTRFPDSPAIIEGNRACTYSQLHARVERLAGALASRGVSSGGHVVYVSTNSAVFAEFVLTCSRIGAVCEIHNIRLSDQMPLSPFSLPTHGTVWARICPLPAQSRPRSYSGTRRTF